MLARNYRCTKDDLAASHRHFADWLPVIQLRGVVVLARHSLLAVNSGIFRGVGCEFF